MEHMMISVRNLQAFNMAAVLTDLKKKKKNKKKKKQIKTHTMISVSCAQAFNMAAVLTDNNKTNKNTHDDFSQLSTSFRYGRSVDC